MTKDELFKEVLAAHPNHTVHQGQIYIPWGPDQIVVTDNPTGMGGIDLWNVSRHRGDGRGGFEGQADFMVDVPAEAVVPTLNVLTAEMSPEATTVYIPGTVLAVYDNGEIIRLTFIPHAGDAGYFGPSAEVIDQGDDGLDVEDTDGPFWRAMQTFLSGKRHSPSITWVE